MNSLKKGDRVIVSGDSSELWIEDYNVRVSTEATVEQTPDKYSKKVLLTLDTIDGEKNVCCFVRKSKIKLLSRYVVRVYTENYSFENYSDNIYLTPEKDVRKSDILAEETANTEDNLLVVWMKLLKKYAGYTYCVKDLLNDGLIIAGVYDPGDFECIKDYFTE